MQLTVSAIHPIGKWAEWIVTPLIPKPQRLIHLFITARHSRDTARRVQ
jgi:hypothetical protein